MNLITADKVTQTCWFVGAMYGAGNNQLERFIQEGIWENGYDDKYLELVKSIQVGDCIAIKAAYTRKHDLPFDGRGHTASVMDIKAVGIVTENAGDGRTIKVDWQLLTPYRQWYFFTSRTTIWKVSKGDWAEDALIAFTFEGKEQDLNLFRNYPYWRERFGDTQRVSSHFQWTRFYEELANKLLKYKHKRQEIVEEFHTIAASINSNAYNDQYEKGVSGGPLKDICPFTILSIFNRGLTDQNRKDIALKLAQFLDVSEPLPQSFDGIPVMNMQNSWFFGYAYKRKDDDIDTLWDVFEKAIYFADANDENIAQAQTNFLQAYDEASRRYMVGWTLTMGLYWVRPWFFPTLDSASRTYIETTLSIILGKNGYNNRCSASDYLIIKESLEARFQEESFPVHSFPELSLEAWRGSDGQVTQTLLANEEINADEEDTIFSKPVPYPIYTIDNILEDGCFLPKKNLEKIISSLRSKKNLILQGAPGTGKTWLAKKLAFALMGQRNESAVRAIQFHPNLSYEDFIRGWRPAENNSLDLIDGPLMELVHTALQNPTSKYVLVIEEINRGNPAQIFGEMLTLLEAGKRSPSDALELSYSREKGERIYVPENVYIIGTMNIADRSLALVDLALRRRFAFIDLEPMLGETWRKWLHEKNNIPFDTLADIEERILELNIAISNNRQLGKQFRIGHSYVTPSHGGNIEDAREWFIQIVETQIWPLLDEYFNDNPQEGDRLKNNLIEGF